MERSILFPGAKWILFILVSTIWLIVPSYYLSFPSKTSANGSAPTPASAFKSKEQAERKECIGKYVYIHQLPGEFNEKILQDCRKFNPWTDMCKYIPNSGFGAVLNGSKDAFLGEAWFDTYQFFLDLIFHNRMKQYRCLTSNSTKSDAIFVPYYAGFDLARHVWGSDAKTRDNTSLALVDWLQRQPEWRKMQGKDHFMAAGRISWDFRRGTEQDQDWGNKLLNLPAVVNMTTLLVESSPWHENDIAIPYPTSFHPSKLSQVVKWQKKIRTLNRGVLFSFAGAQRPGMKGSIRDMIFEQCKASVQCKLLELKNRLNSFNPTEVVKLFQESVFCLQPPGDTATRRSFFDSIINGCIPVLFNPNTADTQYIWYLPKNASTYSIFISEDDMRTKNVSIEKILVQIDQVQIANLRETVISLIPKIIYADSRIEDSERMNDAFEIAVEGVISRIKEMKMKDAPST